MSDAYAVLWLPCDIANSHISLGGTTDVTTRRRDKKIPAVDDSGG